jgi:hypothetical protein
VGRLEILVGVVVLALAALSLWAVLTILMTRV